jgi:hypothetical protein
MQQQNTIISESSKLSFYREFCTKDISDIIRWSKYLIEAMMIFVLIGNLPNSERLVTFKVLQWTPSSSLINCTWNFRCSSESLHFRTDSMPHISHSSLKRSPVFKDHYFFEPRGTVKITY